MAGILLGLLQLMPLAPRLLEWIAPASAAIHYPENARAHQVLGTGWRPVSIEPFATEAELLRLGSLVAAFYLFGHLFFHRRDIKLFGFGVAMTGVALSLFAVYQNARWGTILYGRFPVPSATPFGPFVNHNHFAGFVEMCALVSLGGAIGHLGRRTYTISILLAGAAMFMGAAVVLSQSRGGLLAATAGAACLGFLAVKGRRRLGAAILSIWGAAIMLLILIAAPSGVFDRIGSITHGTQDISMQFRLRLWSDSAGLVLRSPLVGTGLGTYAAAIPPYRSGLDETRAEFAENDLLQLTCEVGVAGVVVFVGFILAVAQRAREKHRGKQQHLRGSQGLVMGATAAAFALLVHSIFDFNTHIPSNSLLFSALLGIIVGSHPPDVSHRANRSLRRLVPALLVLILSILLAGKTLAIGWSRYEVGRVNPSRTEPKAFADLAARLTTARELAPDNPEIAFKHGLLYSEEAYRARDADRYRELRYTQAREASEGAVRRAPARGRYWFELAWTEGNLGNDKVARPLFEHAICLEPNSSRLRANYASYLASRNRINEALRQLDTAIRLIPGISSRDAASIIGPYLGNDTDDALRGTSGDNEKRR